MPTRSDKDRNPRCTETFTADSDMPYCAAASLTLNPSSLTIWMARLVGLSLCHELLQVEPAVDDAGIVVSR